MLFKNKIVDKVLPCFYEIQFFFQLCVRAHAHTNLGLKPVHVYTYTKLYAYEQSKWHHWISACTSTNTHVYCLQTWDL